MRVKNFIEIALSHFISMINTVLRLTQKFKMAAKVAGKQFLRKVASSPADTLWVKIFVKIARPRSVSGINRFLHLTQKFKMAAKSQIPCG